MFRTLVVSLLLVLYLCGIEAGKDHVLFDQVPWQYVISTHFPVSAMYGELLGGNIGLIQTLHQTSVLRETTVYFPSGLWLVLAAIVAVCGQQRWKCVLHALAGVCLVSWILIPIFYGFVPALAHSGMLEDMGVLFLVYLCSAAVYYVVVPVLWPELAAATQGGVGLDDISPAKGRTVKQIREEGTRVKKKRFLFGKADEELAARWGLIGKAMLALARTRRRQAATVAVALCAWPVLVYGVAGGSEGIFQREVELMWETVPLPGREGEVIAPEVAFEAAQRVFKGGEHYLRGLTPEEARQLLRFDLMNPLYKMNVPRYPWEKDRTFLRISTGFESAYLIIGLNDEGKIAISWLEIHRDCWE